VLLSRVTYISILFSYFSSTEEQKSRGKSLIKILEKKKQKLSKKRLLENKRRLNTMRSDVRLIPRDHNSADFLVVITKYLAYHTHFYVIISRKIKQRDYINYIFM